MKTMAWARGLINGLFNPRPSIFDLSVAGILVVGFLPDKFWQGMFFVFYSILVIILTSFIKPKRDYISVPFSLLVLWSFFMIFVHNNSIKIVENSFMNNWLNMSIMFEGFIYIFAGFMLFRSIVVYSRNLKFVFIVLPFTLMPIMKVNMAGGRMTMPMAFIAGILIYLFLNRRYFLGLVIGIMSATEVICLWKWIMMKWSCRPWIWKQLLDEIYKHPIVGSGFNHTLDPENMIWISQKGNVNYGWIYRHNDYLSLGACLGAIVIILLLWFIIETLDNIRKSVYLIPFLMILFTAFFQITFFEPVKAAACLVILGVCVKETCKKGERA